MPKERINKFIFQDGKSFLRFKTKAEDLTLKKIESNYFIEFSTGPKMTSIPLLFLPDLNDLDASSAEETNFRWGKMLKIVDCYYLTPKRQNFAVRFGPIPANTLDLTLVIDWPNVQWSIL